MFPCAEIIGVDDVTYRGPGDDGGADGPVGDASGDIAVCHPDAIANDPRNCGACGHDCLDGQCNQGACLTLQLTTITGLVEAIATSLSAPSASSWVYAGDDVSLYFIENGTNVMRVAL